jgi:hypothetical protein
MTGRGWKTGKRRRRRFDGLPYFCTDPAQMWLPVDWAWLDEKGRQTVEAAQAAQVEEMLALTTNGGNYHGEK